MPLGLCDNQAAVSFAPDPVKSLSYVPAADTVDVHANTIPHLFIYDLGAYFDRNSRMEYAGYTPAGVIEDFLLHG